MMKNLNHFCFGVFAILCVLIVVYFFFGWARKIESFENLGKRIDIQGEIKKGNVVFLKLHAEWCGYCKKLQPEWEKLEKKYENDTKIMIADIEEKDEETLKRFMQQFPKVQIQGYPTLLLITQKGVLSYDDARSFESMDTFLQKEKMA